MYRIIKNTHPHSHYQVQTLYKILWWEFWLTRTVRNFLSPNGEDKFTSLEEAEKALRLIKHKDIGNQMTVVKEEK